MRIPLRLTMPGLVLLAGAVAMTSLALAADLNLEGNWKLVVSPATDTEFLILKTETKDGKPAAEVLSFNQNLGAMEVRKIEQKGDSLTLVVFARAAENVFTGKLVQEGDAAGQVLGVFRFGGRAYPARLEKTEAEKVTVAPATMPPGFQQYSQARLERDPKAKIEKLQAALALMKGPGRSLAYQAILEAAPLANLGEQQVRDTVNEFLNVAKPYGDTLVTDYRAMALKALQGKKQYAVLTLELAQEAEKQLPADATLDQQSAVLTALASSAKLAGKNELADATAARVEKIEHQLDEEYHKKVPPFKPETFAGRASAEQDRVVLMELFTGAQCPPCVAADVAFDALISTYKPTEVVTLQYHLHIPGPDPMTNADSEARAKLYGVNSTPSTLFNGVADARGGGGMANAQAKYDQYRKIIDAQLANTKNAKIDLRLTRSGEQIMVSGTAQAKADENAKLRLRLVLTEEIVKYIGGNQLRFHHHVVRGFPGGVQGKEVVAGEVSLNQTIDLNEVRKVLTSYVDTFAQTRPFANTPPEMGGELSLVAFIQNDEDKSILHAISVPVPKK